MKKSIANKIQTATEGIAAASNMAVLISPWFATVPLIVFCVNRTIGLISDDDIIKRLKKFEDALTKKRITKKHFKEKVAGLSEHKKFFASSTLEYIIKNCIPETVDIYISLFIDYIMADKYDIEEELCEIILSLNKHDIELLKYIRKFLKTGDKTIYQKELKAKNNNMGYKADDRDDLFMFTDRNVILDKNRTIFWEDFATFCNLSKTITLNETMLLEKCENEANCVYHKWNFYGKSFIKLEKLGILSLDYHTFLGTMNNMEISRFHLTILGLELLKYIKIDYD